MARMALSRALFLCLCRAGAAIGATDALFAALFGFDDVCGCAAYDQQYDRDEDPVDYLHAGSPVSVLRILRLQIT